jgi:hypothetical protein
MPIRVVFALFVGEDASLRMGVQYAGFHSH